MAPSAQPFQLLYISRAQPGAGPDSAAVIVGAIVAVSLPRNSACGISGALLFDGARFCQLLEGAESEVRRLMLRIELDERHTQVRVLAAGPCVSPRLMQRWSHALCAASDLDDFEAAAPAREEVALALFMSLLKHVDPV